MIARVLPRDFVFSLTNRSDANPEPIFRRVNVGSTVWFEKLSRYLLHAKLIIMNFDTLTDAVRQEIAFIESECPDVPLWLIIWADARAESERIHPSFFRRPRLLVTEKAYKTDAPVVTALFDSVWKEVLATRADIPGPPIVWTRDTRRTASYRVGPEGEWRDLGAALDVAVDRAGEEPWSAAWEELERAVLATPPSAPLALTLSATQARVLKPTL